METWLPHGVSPPGTSGLGYDEVKSSSRDVKTTWDLDSQLVHLCLSLLAKTDHVVWEMNSAFMERIPTSLTEGTAVGRGEELGPLITTGGAPSHVCAASLRLGLEMGRIACRDRNLSLYFHSMCFLLKSVMLTFISWDSCKIREVSIGSPNKVTFLNRVRVTRTGVIWLWAQLGKGKLETVLVFQKYR